MYRFAFHHPLLSLPYFQVPVTFIGHPYFGRDAHPSRNPRENDQSLRSTYSFVLLVCGQPLFLVGESIEARGTITRPESTCPVVPFMLMIFGGLLQGGRRRCTPRGP